MLTDRARVAAEQLALGAPRAAAMRAGGYRANARPEDVNPAFRQHLGKMRKEAELRFKITRDTVLQGFLDAIDDAKLAGDAANQISGWREVGRMLGYYEPERHVIELTGSQQQIMQQLSTLPDDKLLEFAGGAVIEGEFSFDD